jgi:long-chain acyl-CoA synthetase
VKIISKDGSLVDQNVNGEICVKGGMVMKGYLNESDNKNAFWGDYFRTGDLGYIDKDGYVYLVGREKEMINVGGKKVGPQEVEDAIISCGVGDCICIGIDDETGVLGEKIVAFVLKGSTEKTFEELSNQLRTKLELYKIPSLFEWIDEIPKSLSGKKMRVELKSKYINIH